jgi:hypothetical protein
MEFFEDYEREALKDFIYLQEEQIELEEAYKKYFKKLPAEIIVINKIKSLTDEPTENKLFTI